MFGRLNRLIENISKLDQQRIFVEIVSDLGVQAYILGLNLTDQLFVDGENSEGDSLGQYQSFSLDKYGKSYTVERYFIDDVGVVQSDTVSKTVFSGDDYTLLDTGDLYGSFKISVDGDGFVITGNTMKEDEGEEVDIESVYGKIVGLNEKSKSELAEAIIPLVVTKVRRLLLS